MIVGHQKQWEFLRKSAEMNRISHAYLFFGQSQLGKKTMALEFIKLLFCQRTPHHFSSDSSGQTNFTKSGGECQICRSCQDIQKGINPDLLLIQPQRPTSAKASVGKREIQISQIRELNWRLSLRPYSAPFKVSIIDESHCMNSEAQSCFLKTLEEPKGKTILILITEHPELLFPTILSRVQEIRFFPVPKSEIEDYLQNQGVSSKEAQKIALFSFGKPGLAIDFLSDPQKLENQNQKIREIEKLSQSDLSFRFQYIKDLISQKQNLKEILDIWLRYFREVLLLALSPQPSALSQPLQDYSLLKLKNTLQAIERINFLISTTNINSRLAFEILMLQL